MRNLLRCRRGSATFATVVALVPLVGAMALGAEAGSWYVTKQHAQNAADAAAISAGMRLACTISSSSSCDTTQDYVYRGKQFASQNGFCNSGESFPGSVCPTSLPSGISRTVQIDQGTFAGGAWTSSAGGSFVRAVTHQQQPAYLSKLLGLSTVDIAAQAIAEVKNPKDLCALGLGPTDNALTIGGSSNITGNGCGLMSDTNVKYNSTPTFSGPGWAVNGVNGCVASTAHCDLSVPYNYNMLPATNPLSGLDTASFNSRKSPVTSPCGGGGNVNNGETCSLIPNSGGGVYSNLKVNSGGTLNLAAGTYFFYNAAITFNGNVTGVGVTLILLGDSSLTIGSANVDLSAPATNSFSSLLNGVLIDDQAPRKSNNAVNISGGGIVKLGGAMYFPNVDVTYGGTTQSTHTTCAEVLANTLTINGNAFLSTQNCAPGTIARTQVIALVH